MLKTVDGLYAVAVSGDVEVDEKERIAHPQGVFEEGSTIVAVELGVLPAGEYLEEPNPYDLEDAEEGNGNPEPVKVTSKGPKYGTFIVVFTDDEEVKLRGPIPRLGQITE